MYVRNVGREAEVRVRLKRERKRLLILSANAPAESSHRARSPTAVRKGPLSESRNPVIFARVGSFRA